MNQKEIAVSFLQLVASGHVREAYEQYVHADFFHHNPYFAGDRESLLKGMEESAAGFPDKVFEAIRAVEEDDMVAVHGRVRLKPGAADIALMHLFRFEDDLIMEEWEVAQQIPEEPVNENGMF